MHLRYTVYHLSNMKRKTVNRGTVSHEMYKTDWFPVGRSLLPPPLPLFHENVMLWALTALTNTIRPRSRHARVTGSGLLAFCRIRALYMLRTAVTATQRMYPVLILSTVRVGCL